MDHDIKMSDQTITLQTVNNDIIQYYNNFKQSLIPCVWTRDPFVGSYTRPRETDLQNYVAGAKRVYRIIGKHNTILHLIRDSKWEEMGSYLAIHMDKKDKQYILAQTRMLQDIYAEAHKQYYDKLAFRHPKKLQNDLKVMTGRKIKKDPKIKTIVQMLKQRMRKYWNFNVWYIILKEFDQDQHYCISMDAQDYEVIDCSTINNMRAELSGNHLQILIQREAKTLWIPHLVNSLDQIGTAMFKSWFKGARIAMIESFEQQFDIAKQELDFLLNFGKNELLQQKEQNIAQYLETKVREMDSKNLKSLLSFLEKGVSGITQDVQNDDFIDHVEEKVEEYLMSHAKYTEATVVAGYIIRFIKQIRVLVPEDEQSVFEEEKNRCEISKDTMKKYQEESNIILDNLTTSVRAWAGNLCTYYTKNVANTLMSTVLKEVKKREPIDNIISAMYSKLDTIRADRKKYAQEWVQNFYLLETRLNGKVDSVREEHKRLLKGIFNGICQFHARIIKKTIQHNSKKSVNREFVYVTENKASDFTKLRDMLSVICPPPEDVHDLFDNMKMLLEKVSETRIDPKHYRTVKNSLAAHQDENITKINAHEYIFLVIDYITLCIIHKFYEEHDVNPKLK